jgi:hypothetical protein
MEDHVRIEAIDERLVEVVRYLAPGQVASAPFARTLLAEVADAAMSAQPPQWDEMVVPVWLAQAEGRQPARLLCRVARAGSHRVATVDGRLGVDVVVTTAEPVVRARIVAVSVVTPWRDDTREPLSTTCRVNGDGAAVYEWWFGRGGRRFVVRVRGEEDGWRADAEREPTPIEAGVVEVRFTAVAARTPADAFRTVVAKLPKPRRQVGDVTPRHGLGARANG